jgi:hypothetical protein
VERKDVMLVATLFLVGAAGIVAAANSVGIYMVSALCLGGFIAMQS